MSGFTDRLTEEMQYQGLRKADIAAVCNIPDSTVRSWFTRDSIPPADIAVKLAKLLNVTVEYLVTGNTLKIRENYSAEEKMIIEKFRLLSPHDKLMVSSVLDTAYNMAIVQNGKKELQA